LCPGSSTTDLGAAVRGKARKPVRKRRMAGARSGCAAAITRRLITISKKFLWGLRRALEASIGRPVAGGRVRKQMLVRAENRGGLALAAR
jgi:hypothetical protein